MGIPAKKATWFLTAALLITTFVPAKAASVRRYQLDEVRDQAVSVFWGQVVEQSTRIGPEGKMVWTDYEISVSEHLKGTDPGPRTRVSFAGGTAGDLTIGIPGVPRLEAGDTFVFFIQKGTRHPTATVGWGQGLYRVARVNLGGTPRDLLVSYDGEPLQIGFDGRLTRGPSVRIENGSIWDASLRLDPRSARMADPVMTAADGTAIPQTRTAAPEVVPIHERHWATLDDLRAFVDGRIEASRGGQR